MSRSAATLLRFTFNRICPPIFKSSDVVDPSLQAEHPQLEIILVADKLYARAPLIHLLHAKRFSFLLVINPRDQKSLFEDIDGRRLGKMLDPSRNLNRSFEVTQV